MIDFLDNIYAGACQSEAQPPKDKDSKHLSRKEQEELVNTTLNQIEWDEVSMGVDINEERVGLSIYNVKG